jgi:hypothetical protein
MLEQAMTDEQQNIQNDAPNQGAQGQFHGDVTAGGNVKNVRQVTIGAGGTYIEGREQPAPHHLRAPVADFVGHEQEIAELHQALTAGDRAAAICGVRGMGGIGKTELAYVVVHRLAAHFPDAQLVTVLRRIDANIFSTWQSNSEKKMPPKQDR